LSEKQKAVKGSLEWWHDRATGGTGRAKLSGGGIHIFASNLCIFGPNQLQISFLLLQNSIFQIFVPKIK